ncbi:MAG: PEGA domain-containing protein [Deltaproteobacteria bacterium]|nr:PEGA domain-containing protein [Deltaproteobacteria bacterium]
MRIRIASLPLAILLFGGIASAGPAEEAGVHFREGLRLFSEQDFAGARTAFEAAYRTLPNALVLANIADCLVEEERPAEAVQAYRRFLREAGPDADREARDRAIARIALVRPSVSDLLVRGEPAGAEVAVDGRPVGALPMTERVALQPGPHFVDVEAPGHRAAHRRIEAATGEEVDLLISLERTETSAEENTSVVEAGGSVEAERPDGPRRRHPPPRRPEVPVGRGPLLWAGIGATALFASAAIVAGFVALSRQDDYSDPDTSLARRRELWSSRNTWPIVTDVAIDAAIVAGLLTAALWVFAGRDDERPPSARLELGEGGVACELRWQL